MPVARRPSVAFSRASEVPLPAPSGRRACWSHHSSAPRAARDVSRVHVTASQPPRAREHPSSSLTATNRQVSRSYMWNTRVVGLWALFLLLVVGCGGIHGGNIDQGTEAVIIGNDTEM